MAERLPPLCFQRYKFALALHKANSSLRQISKKPEKVLSSLKSPLYSGIGVPSAPPPPVSSCSALVPNNDKQENTDNESSDLTAGIISIEVDVTDVEEIVWDDTPLGQEIDEFVWRQMRAQTAH